MVRQLFMCLKFDLQKKKFYELYKWLQIVVYFISMAFKIFSPNNRIILFCKGSAPSWQLEKMELFGFLQLRSKVVPEVGTQIALKLNREVERQILNHVEKIPILRIIQCNELKIL